MSLIQFIPRFPKWSIPIRFSNKNLFPDIRDISSTSHLIMSESIWMTMKWYNNIALHSSYSHKL